MCDGPSCVTLLTPFMFRPLSGYRRPIPGVNHLPTEVSDAGEIRSPKSACLSWSVKPKFTPAPALMNQLLPEAVGFSFILILAVFHLFFYGGILEADSESAPAANTVNNAIFFILLIFSYCSVVLFPFVFFFLI